VPEPLSLVRQTLEDLLRDLQTDLIETEQQISEIENQAAAASSDPENGADAEQELNREQSNLQQKTGELKSAISQIEHLKLRYNMTERRVRDALNKSKNAPQALRLFEEIAKKYLKQTDGFSNSRWANENDSNTSRKDSGYRLVGDTVHSSKKDQLTQTTIDNLENEIRNTGIKGNKISIDGVDQLDFSLLEKNGYTISKSDSNEYSAYKTINS
jgi:hypothetical protein